MHRINLHNTICTILLVGLVCASVFTPLSSVRAAEDARDPVAGGCLYWEDTWAPDYFPSINPKACLAVGINMLLSLFSWAVEAGGVLLDIAIRETVLEMSDRIDDIGGVDDAWSIMRDLANMAFIFILVWIAIRTILSINDSQNKKILGYAIVIGLLVNFSLFFTQIVIDASNFIAVEFYDEIVPPEGTEKEQSIAIRLLEDMRLPTTYDLDISGTDLAEVYGNRTFGAIAVQGFGAIILFLITAFVFMTAAILLVIRFVVLVFLMILSPLAFVAYVLPKTQNQSEKWFDRLVRESFWVPVYFGLLYISLQITEAFHAANNSNMSIGDALAQPGKSMDAASTLLNFFIIIGFFVASLFMAKQIGASGASQATKIGKGWGTFLAGASTASLAGRFGRRYIGRTAERLYQSEGLTKLATQSGVVGTGARFVRGTADRTAQSSFDIRNVNGAKNLGLGKGGGKGGYRKQNEEDTEKAAEVAKSLAPNKTNLVNAKRRADEALNQAETQPQKDLTEVNEQIATAEEKIRNEQNPSQRRYYEQVAAAYKEKKGQIEQRIATGAYDKNAVDARQEADKLSGVDLKELKKRVTSNRNIVGTLGIKDAKNNDITDVDEARKAIDKMDQKTLEGYLNTDRLKNQNGTDLRDLYGLRITEGEKERRTKEYANTVENAGFWTRFGTRTSKRERLENAEAIRETLKDKTVNEKLKELYKENKDLRGEEDANIETENNADAETSNNESNA